MSKQPLIEISNLKKHFKVGKGYLHAVDGVDMNIDMGKTMGVVGESGCGKSTLGRLILRLIEPTDGAVFYEGKSILDYSEKQFCEMRKKMQIIFQDPYSSIDPRMTVSEIIAEPLLINKSMPNKRETYKRVFGLMEKVGLAARQINAYPHELDGGRRQRIGIARALALDPKFIVCDEPVSALDVSIQAQILNLLMDLQEDMGLTYMFITHDLSVVRHISDEITVMYLGQCVERAPSKELFRNPLHPYTKALLDAIPIPDPDLRGKKRKIIEGEIASPINPKPGCRFLPRCEMKSDGCNLQTEMKLIEYSDNHYVACSLY